MNVSASTRALPAMAAACLAPFLAAAQHGEEPSGHAHHEMAVEAAGAVMNENRDRLPHGCAKISAEHRLTIHAGRDYANGVPGMIFGMSSHVVRVEPCSRVEVTFVNEDAVRHQWMVHGLPKYLYPAGMFHIEAAGAQSRTGTFIVPGEHRTYLIHCDIAQHMEKGMRGQLVVGDGSGDLWGVSGVSGDFYRSPYLSPAIYALAATGLLASFLVTLALLRH